jgi:SAM-dependent methyltransferase
MSTWEDPETAAYYEAFCSRHSRYVRANHALVSHAQIASGMQILDVGAGTGRTAEMALPSLGKSGRVLCFEPSTAMREEGMRRLIDDRVNWTSTCPNAGETFDRILCGASIWLLDLLPETLRTLAGLLCAGGALCFNIPALYLLEADEPGGGGDPSLLSLQELLLASAGSLTFRQTIKPEATHSLDHGLINAWLNAAGLRALPWSFRMRITQASFADWLKIPVLTEQLLGGLSPKARAERIDEALKSVDCSSWKWERWRGWTAWKSSAV